VEADDMEMFAGLVHGKFGGSIERATEWLKHVAANQPEVHKGHTETTELLAAGQGSVFFGVYAHRVETLKEKRAPLEWMKSEAAQLLQAGGIVKGAPHPNAARLFLNWLLSEEGQKAVSDVGRVPSRPGVKLQAPLLPEGIKLYPARPEHARNYQELTLIWKETFGLR
jgi:iron(III) transport system substrate-binding protein